MLDHNLHIFIKSLNTCISSEMTLKNNINYIHSDTADKDYFQVCLAVNYALVISRRLTSLYYFNSSENTSKFVL